MNDLAIINGKNAMTSREIAEVTGKEHKSIMRDIRVLNEQVNDLGGYRFVLSSYTNSQNKEQPMYELNKKACLLLASGYNPILRAKIIDRWEELENQLKPQLPQDYLSALKALVASEEEKQKLLPKAEYCDKVLLPMQETEDGKFIKLVTTSDIAKDIGMSAIKLNKLLNANGIIYKKGKTWFLYEKYQDKIPEYCDYIINEFGQTLKWTELGRKFIIDILNK
jgi:Rha family phage regulatory protein